MGFVDEAHAFRPEKLYLPVLAPERKGLRDAAVAFDHTVAGDDAGLRVDVEGIAYHPGEALVADGLGDLAVGGDISFRYILYYLINPIKNVDGITLFFLASSPAPLPRNDA